MSAYITVDHKGEKLVFNVEIVNLYKIKLNGLELSSESLSGLKEIVINKLKE